MNMTAYVARSVFTQMTAVVIVADFVSRFALRSQAAARHGLWLGALLWVLVSPLVAIVASRTDMTLWAVRLP